jgi:hypothetical protein
MNGKPTNFLAAGMATIAVAIAVVGTLAFVASLVWLVLPSDQTLVQEGTGIARRVLGEDPEKWQRFIYNYQTLIGGVLAVVAAVITVLVMIIVDRRQASRHNELVALNLRQDKLRLERLLVPQFKSLWFQVEKLRPPSSAVLAVSEQGKGFPKLEEYVQEVVEAAHEVRDCLQAESWKASMDLFDGTLTAFCKSLENYVFAIYGHKTGFDQVLNLIRFPDYNAMQVASFNQIVTKQEREEWIHAQDMANRQRLRDHAAQLSEDASVLQTTIILVTDELRKLARSYGIKPY